MFASTIICNHSFLSRLINDKSVVVDLGCNQGEFSLAIMQQFKCKVVAVEPVKALYDKIMCDEEIQKYGLLNLRQLAVGGKNGTIEINVYHDQWGSVLDALSAEEGHTKQQVEMVTLGELRKRAGVAQIDLLKMDIEGAEIDLLNGTSDEDLQSVMQLTVEFHEFLFPEHAQPVAKIIERMKALGFWAIPFSMGTTDVLFINKKTGVGSGEFNYLRTIEKYTKGVARRVRNTLAS